MTQTPRLVLASGSPQRRLLLAAAGFDFFVDPADVDETDYAPNLAPAAVAGLLADRKASAVSARHPDAVVLAADTVVAAPARPGDGTDSVLLGKPTDADDARRILRLLSGSQHEVFTGVRIVRGATALNVGMVVRSAVSMRPLSDAEIEAYVAGGNWRGKAGGYGIQDDDPFVTRMEGSRTNIIGLPMDECATLLESAGVRPSKNSS